MMRCAVRSAQEYPAAISAHVRHFVALPKLEFTEDVALPKTSASNAPSALDDWSAKKAGTTEMMKLMKTYKEIGDHKDEPYLQFHNPRTFEDMSKPVPNFRAMGLKAGQVPKFFDAVLSGRAEDSVEKKGEWWAERKKEAEFAAKGKSYQPFASIPVPEWKVGKAVPLESLKAVTDAYVKGMEPKRKLKLPVLPAGLKDALAAFAKDLKQDKALPDAQKALIKALSEKSVVVEGGKSVEGFEFTSKAIAAQAIAARRAQVHERYMKFWAKKVLVSPELAVVPLKDVDAQLASKFENVSPEFTDLLSAVQIGPKTLGERVSESPAMDTFLLKRDKEAVVGDFPASDVEKQGAAMAAKLADPAAALLALLGPEASPLGAAGVPMSEQIKAITMHKYAPDRYMYKEGMALAEKYAAQEAAIKEELMGVYGDAADVPVFQAAPRAPVQQMMDRQKELELRAAEFAAETKSADSAYTAYAIAKKQEFMTDASNIAFEEVLYPEVVSEMLSIELAELDEAEAAIDDAEEEELWALTLSAQFKHISTHFGVDLPHSVMAYMDPLLVKKIDWETTNGLDDWDSVLEDTGAEYAREQWGVESLSHHFLPLIRYRRAKERAARGVYEAETSSVVRS